MKSLNYVPLWALSQVTIGLAASVSPSARWGHSAIWMNSQKAMYVIGGQVVENGGTQITNDVYILPLNASRPSFETGPNDGLPPNAFTASTISKDGSSIVLVGGMTPDCAGNPIAHMINMTSTDDRGDWNGIDPSRLVRRRGASAAWVDNGSPEGEVMVIGGISDHYVCSTSTYTYPAADVLALPLVPNSLVSSRNLPSGLTGSSLAVSDFALAHASDHTLYMAGGQSSDGTLVGFDTIGKWTADGGWTSQATTGDIPSGRIGASLVAHPELDLLVLHGGATSSSTGAGSASNLLALLNSTTWAWSTPSNLQPPASSAASYHSSIMTPEGVMITAFGLGPSGSARSDVFYLDMRDPTGSAWTWKSQWSSSMLDAYTAPTNSNTNSGSNNNGKGVDATSTTSDNKANSSAGDEKKKVTSITVPVILGLLIIIPLAVYFIRRKVRIDRKRRLARYFSFEDQEDNGTFNNATSDPTSSTRQTKTQFSFGQDANEKDGTIISDIITSLKRLSRRDSTDSTTSASGRIAQRRTSRLNEKTMKWEEIDFGLGKVDQSRCATPTRAGSFSGFGRILSATGFGPGPASTSTCDPFADEAAPGSSDSGHVLVQVDGTEGSPRSGTPVHDGQSRLVNPLNVSAQQHDGFNPSTEDGLDWNMLAQELQDRPAFRSIDPNSTLRSHAHANALAQVNDGYRRPSSPGIQRLPGSPLSGARGTRVVSTPPQLPPLDLRRGSWAGAISPTQDMRRSSEHLPIGRGLPISNPHLAHLSGGNGARVISQPVQSMGARPLIEQRRDSAPTINFPDANPSPVRRVSGHEGRTSLDGHVRRASSITYRPASPAGGRESPSPLRVVNLTDSDREEDMQGGQPGQAL